MPLSSIFAGQSVANIIGAIEPVDRASGSALDLSLMPLDEAFELVAGQAKHARVSLQWQVAPTAPISEARGADGRWALVIGNIERDGGGDQTEAEFILDATQKRPGAISSFGGYYLAVVARPDGYVLLGTDIFGFFPLVTWQSKGTIFFGTSANQFRHISGFEAAPDPAGVMSLLLFGYMAWAPTIWKNVRRSLPFQSLSIDPAGNATIVDGTRLQPGAALHGATIEDVGPLYREALKPSLPYGSSGEICILQSGGLDSRTIAGIASHFGLRVKAAVTMGRPDDIELQCARHVSQVMGNPSQAVQVDLAAFPETVDWQLEREALSNGFADFSHAQMIPTLRGLGVPIVNGFLGDSITGGGNLPWGFDARSGQYSFETLMGSLYAYGLSPEVLSRLLKPSFADDQMSILLRDLRGFYDGLSDHGHHKTLLFLNLIRGRTSFGGVLWRHAMAAWPVTPFFNKSTVELALCLPEEWLVERRLQKEFLVRFYPELARLPLDRNSFRTEPLNATAWQRLVGRIQSRRHRALKNLTGQDRRNYYRTFDFNHIGWREIRRRAVPLMDHLEDMVDMDYLRSVIPDPEATLQYDEPFRAPNGLKSLLGLAILMGNASR